MDRLISRRKFYRLLSSRLADGLVKQCAALLPAAVLVGSVAQAEAEKKKASQGELRELLRNKKNWDEIHPDHFREVVRRRRAERARELREARELKRKSKLAKMRRRNEKKAPHSRPAPIKKITAEERASRIARHRIKFEQMSPQVRKEVFSNYDQLAQKSPEGKRRIQDNYRKFTSLNTSEQQAVLAKFDRWMELPEIERQRMRKKFRGA